MSRISPVLRPTPLSCIFFLLGLLFQAAFCSSGSMTYAGTGEGPSSTMSAYGIGGAVTIRTEHGVTHVEVQWALLLLTLVCTYILSSLLALGCAGATRLRRPALSYLGVAAVAIGLAFVASIIMSRLYWGYYLNRPDVHPELRDVVRVNGVASITTTVTNGVKRLEVIQDDSLADDLAYGKKDAYYCLWARLLIELERINLLPSSYTNSMPWLPELYSLLKSSGMLVKPDSGYDPSDTVGGIVVDAVSRSGDGLMILGVGGPQQSNDHYPYYELLFVRDAKAPGLRYVRGQRFFYDVAGIEGAEWYSDWIILSLLGIPATFLVFTLAVGLRNLLTQKRKKQECA